ncbi:MAG TPA: Fe-Mn family superoxide dismutase, partial [Candidatus Paceibacterota bacterium]|nr:Fe-Mn family superoxide dismutase [Candidatus Paceibacterota bacterium]
NGMRLHEYYFGGMTKDGQGIDQSSKLHGKIAEEFGSYENWEKDFRGTGAMRGIGWAVLAHDKEADRLFNVWVNEHDMGHLAGATPVLIMDVFEHAFMVDYGTKRAEYIDAFMKAIDWEVSESRFS